MGFVGTFDICLSLVFKKKIKSTSSTNACEGDVSLLGFFHPGFSLLDNLAAVKAHLNSGLSKNEVSSGATFQIYNFLLVFMISFTTVNSVPFISRAVIHVCAYAYFDFAGFEENLL